MQPQNVWMTPFLVKLRQSVLPRRLTSLSPAQAQAGARLDTRRGGTTRWLGQVAGLPPRLRSCISSISHWLPPLLCLPCRSNVFMYMLPTLQVDESHIRYILIIYFAAFVWGKHCGLFIYFSFTRFRRNAIYVPIYLHLEILRSKDSGETSCS